MWCISDGAIYGIRRGPGARERNMGVSYYSGQARYSGEGAMLTLSLLLGVSCVIKFSQKMVQN
jgi:hypothetical protein